jgi:hypothetical protein
METTVPALMTFVRRGRMAISIRTVVLRSPSVDYLEAVRVPSPFPRPYLRGRPNLDIHIHGPAQMCR